MTKDAFYFPHFSNARIDRKLRRVRKELGLEGYGIYFMILETLREQAEYKYPVADIDLLADEFVTSEQKVRTVITNYELFTIDEDQNFFSPKMIMFLQPYLEGKERRRIGGIRGNLIKYKHITKDESKLMSDEDILDKHGNLAYKKSLISLTESPTDPLPSQRKEVKKGKETEKVNNKSKEVKHKHGEYKKVLLTDTQYNSLLTDWGLEELNRMIKLLDESMEMNPKYKYSNFKIALTKWKNNSFNSPTKKDAFHAEANFTL